MPTWRFDDGIDDMPPRSLEVFAEIDAALDEVPGDRLIIRSMTIGTDFGNRQEFEVEVELAPGAIVVVSYSSVDVAAGSTVHSCRTEVARHVLGAVTDVCSRGRGKAADMLHDLRVRVRRTLAEWTAEGAPVALRDARLRRSEESDPDDPFGTEVRLDVIDDALRPAIKTIRAAHPDRVDAELGKAEARLRRLFAIRTELGRRGATGSVDRLVLNALSLGTGDVSAALRRASRAGFASWHGDLELFIEEGLVRCRGGREGLTWNRGGIRLENVVIPEPVRLAAVGRPVTDLIEHPVLSDDMIVTKVLSEDDLIRFTDVSFDQPALLYDGVTGRTWPRR